MGNEVSVPTARPSLVPYPDHASANLIAPNVCPPHSRGPPYSGSLNELGPTDPNGPSAQDPTTRRPAHARRNLDDAEEGDGISGKDGVRRGGEGDLTHSSSSTAAGSSMWSARVEGAALRVGSGQPPARPSRRRHDDAHETDGAASNDSSSSSGSSSSTATTDSSASTVARLSSEVDFFAQGSGRRSSGAGSSSSHHLHDSSTTTAAVARSPQTERRRAAGRRLTDEEKGRYSALGPPVKVTQQDGTPVSHKRADDPPHSRGSRPTRSGGSEQPTPPSLVSTSAAAAEKASAKMEAHMNCEAAAAGGTSLFRIGSKHRSSAFGSFVRNGSARQATGAGANGDDGDDMLAGSGGLDNDDDRLPLYGPVGGSSRGDMDGEDDARGAGASSFFGDASLREDRSGGGGSFFRRVSSRLLQRGLGSKSSLYKATGEKNGKPGGGARHHRNKNSSSNGTASALPPPQQQQQVRSPAAVARVSSFFQPAEANATARLYGEIPSMHHSSHTHKADPSTARARALNSNHSGSGGEYFHLSSSHRERSPGGAQGGMYAASKGGGTGQTGGKEDGGGDRLSFYANFDDAGPDRSSRRHKQHSMKAEEGGGWHNGYRSEASATANGSASRVLRKNSSRQARNTAVKPSEAKPPRSTSPTHKGDSGAANAGASDGSITPPPSFGSDAFREVRQRDETSRDKQSRLSAGENVSGSLRRRGRERSARTLIGVGRLRSTTMSDYSMSDVESDGSGRRSRGHVGSASSLRSASFASSSHGSAHDHRRTPSGRKKEKVERKSVDALKKKAQRMRVSSLSSAESLSRRSGSSGSTPSDTEGPVLPPALPSAHPHRTCNGGSQHGGGGALRDRAAMLRPAPPTLAKEAGSSFERRRGGPAPPPTARTTTPASARALPHAAGHGGPSAAPANPSTRNPSVPFLVRPVGTVANTFNNADGRGKTGGGKEGGSPSRPAAHHAPAQEQRGNGAGGAGATGVGHFPSMPPIANGMGTSAGSYRRSNGAAAAAAMPAPAATGPTGRPQQNSSSNASNSHVVHHLSGLVSTAPNSPIARSSSQNNTNSSPLGALSAPNSLTPRDTHRRPSTHRPIDHRSDSASDARLPTTLQNVRYLSTSNGEDSGLDSEGEEATERTSYSSASAHLFFANRADSGRSASEEGERHALVGGRSVAMGVDSLAAHTRGGAYSGFGDNGGGGGDDVGANNLTRGGPALFRGSSSSMNNNSNGMSTVASGGGAAAAPKRRRPQTEVFHAWNVNEDRIKRLLAQHGGGDGVPL